MARNVTRQHIRNLARTYADQRPGGASDDFVPNTTSSTNAGVDALIDLAGAEYYDLLVAAGGPERFITTTAITIIASTASYALPATHYRTHGIVLEWGTRRWEEVRPLDSPMDRVRFNNQATWTEGAPKGYRLEGANVVIFPTPTSAVTGRHYYTPSWVDFTHDTTDTKDFVNGWEKLVALRVAMELREIEQQPYSGLERLFEREKERIETLAADRDDHPSRILDVTRRYVTFPLAETP